MTAPQTAPDPARESMGIDPFERNWMRFSVALLVVFFAAVSIAGLALGFQVPGDEPRVDPATVADAGPFADPGVRQLGDNTFEAYVLARTFTFEPNVIVVPVGAELTVFVTSVDVQHGFKITDTNVNMQVVPGEVSKLSFEFAREGEYPIICTEYCGIGHAAMFASVKVLSPSDFEAMGESEETGEGAGGSG